jgi:glucokinase
VINNKIYRGATGSAAEAGHLTIKFDGLKCSCGNSGCLEAYCSENFFKKKGILPPEAVEKAKAGNKFALKIFKDYGKNLGIGLSNIVNLLDPEVIIIGGGISNAHKFFLEETKKETKKRTISLLSKKYVKIKTAKLGELAGAIGAALLVGY